MNHLSLYSGIGAKDIAAHWAGMHTVAMCDSEPFCRAVLKKNFPGVPIFTSDTKVTVEALIQLGITHIDVLSGGFPCQPYSVAGKQQGASDARDRWPEMHRIIRDVRPTWVVGENVRGLVSSGRLDEICGDLENSDYEVGAFVLPTGCAVGAPHKRERVIIVAHTKRSGGYGWSDNNTGAIPNEQARGRNESTDQTQERCAIRGSESAVGDSHSAGSEEWQGISGNHGAQQPTAIRTGGVGLMADTRRQGQCSGRSDSGNESLEEIQNMWTPDRSETLQRSALADTTGPRRDERGWDTGEPIWNDARREGSHRLRLVGLDERASGGTGQEQRAAQSRVGRVLNGVSDWLDGSRWPAPRGHAQYSWEPPRLTERKDWRPQRIKALGNSAVPQALFPFFAAIAAFEGAQQADVRAAA